MYFACSVVRIEVINPMYKHAQIQFINHSNPYRTVVVLSYSHHKAAVTNICSLQTLIKFSLSRRQMASFQKRSENNSIMERSFANIFYEVSSVIMTFQILVLPRKVLLDFVVNCLINHLTNYYLVI